MYNKWNLKRRLFYKWQGPPSADWDHEHQENIRGL